MDFAGTREVGTTIRSHPQLLNGRLRSTTASCDIIALSMRAPTEVLLAVIATPGVTLLSKRGALQVLLAWKLMCVCVSQKIWGWGEHRSWCSHDLKTTTDGEAKLEAKLIHHTMRSPFHGPIDACRGPCVLAATIQLLNGGLKSTTAERDLLQL